MINSDLRQPLINSNKSLDQTPINNEKIDLFHKTLNGFKIPEDDFRLKNEDFRSYFKPAEYYIDNHNIKSFKKAAKKIYSSLNSKLKNSGADDERLKNINQKIIALNFKINVIMRQKSGLEKTLKFVNENIESILEEIKDLGLTMDDQFQYLNDFVKATIFINFHTKNDGYIEDILLFLKFILIVSFYVLCLFFIIIFLLRCVYHPIHYDDRNKEKTEQMPSFNEKWDVYTITRSLKDIMKEFNVDETSVKNSILSDQKVDENDIKNAIMYSHFI